MSFPKIVALLFCISAMYGCTTVTRGTMDVLIVESEPPGADVEIQPAQHLCKTPCSVKLKRREEQSVKIRREGFEPVEIKVIPQVVGAGAAGMAGNVLVGGIIGAIVDAGSGAMKDLKPNPIKVNLVALKPVAPAEAAPVAPAEVPQVAPEAAPAVTAELGVPATAGTSH